MQVIRGAAVAVVLIACPAAAWSQTPVAPCVTLPGGNGPASCAPVTSSNGLPIEPGQAVIVPLDVATVTTGGVAVTTLAAGHRTAGGWLYSPADAGANLCSDETTVASGTASAGTLTCALPGQTYLLAPSPLGVSVVSSNSSHPFSGQGRQ